MLVRQRLQSNGEAPHWGTGAIPVKWVEVCGRIKSRISWPFADVVHLMSLLSGSGVWNKLVEENGTQKTLEEFYVGAGNDEHHGQF